MVVTSDDEEVLAIRMVMMPRDTNAHGTIFGGHILSLIDQAGAIAGHACGARKLVTVAMDQVEFKEPVHVGDLITCLSTVIRMGRTSITVRVRVVAEAPTAPTKPREVTQAQVVYVHVDEDGAPLPIQANERKTTG